MDGHKTQEPADESQNEDSRIVNTPEIPIPLAWRQMRSPATMTRAIASPEKGSNSVTNWPVKSVLAEGFQGVKEHLVKKSIRLPGHERPDDDPGKG